MIGKVDVDQFGCAGRGDKRDESFGVLAMGSMNAKPLPLPASCAAMLRSNTDLPVPVWPEIKCAERGRPDRWYRDVRRKATRGGTDDDMFGSHGQRGALRRAGQRVALGRLNPRCVTFAFATRR